MSGSLALLSTSLYPSLSDVQLTVGDVDLLSDTSSKDAPNVTAETFASWLNHFGGSTEVANGKQQITNIHRRRKSESKITRSIENPFETFGVHIGDRCIWNCGGKRHPGTIRWIGYLKGHTNVYAGVEFDDDVGIGTGAFQGKQLFKAADKKAGFTVLTSLRIVEEVVKGYVRKSEELSEELMLKTMHNSDLEKKIVLLKSENDELIRMQGDGAIIADQNMCYVGALERQLTLELEAKDRLIESFRWKMANLENINEQLRSIQEVRQNNTVTSPLPSTTSTMMQTDSLSHIQWFEEIQCQICNLNLVFDDGGYCCLEKNCHQPICASCFTRYNAREQQSVEPKCPFCRCNFDYLQIAIPRFDNV